MALTTSELITRVRQNTNRTDTGDAGTPSTQIVDYLNDALKAAARRHNWKDLYIEDKMTLTAGTYRYDTPSGMLACLSVRLMDTTSSENLVERTKVWLNALEPYPEGRGNAKPEVYCMDGNYMEFYPVPDDDYEVRMNYIKWPTELSVNLLGDTPDIDQMDDFLTAYASAEMFASLENFESAVYWRGRAEEMLITARGADNSRPNFKPQTDGVLSGKHGGLPAGYWNRVLALE